MIIHLMNSKEMFQDDVLLKRAYIELHTLTSSIQKIKLIGKYGQFTYTSTLPSRAAYLRSQTWKLESTIIISFICFCYGSNLRHLALITY